MVWERRGEEKDGEGRGGIDREARTSSARKRIPTRSRSILQRCWPGVNTYSYMLPHQAILVRIDPGVHSNKHTQAANASFSPALAREATDSHAISFP